MDDFHDHRDRDGEVRPKLVFNSHHTKRKRYAVKNTVGCGCLGHHDPTNYNCFYTLIKAYMVLKGRSDHSFAKSASKLSRGQRERHLHKDGELKKARFFRAVSRKNKNVCAFKLEVDTEAHLHSNMGMGKVRAVFECRHTLCTGTRR